MAILDARILSTPIKDWWYKFLYRLKGDGSLLKSDGRTAQQNLEITQYISELISSAIWAFGDSIDIVTDVLGWINDKLEELLNVNTVEVDIIQGDALCTYLEQSQTAGRYTEISQNDLNAMRNSVVNVAMDAQGNITDDQMIRSRAGLSVESLEKFQGQPILRIKIPN